MTGIVKKLVTLGALLASGTAYAGVPAWTVSESSGAVQVSRSGLQPAAVTRGRALRAGDVISTGKGGRAVLIRGEEYLVVSPGTRITIADPKPGAMTQIIQGVGNTLFKIKKMATPHFAVQTPYLAAVVKGTTFSVTVTQSGAAVQVTEGRVLVATPDGGASKLVTPGEIGLVNRAMPFRLTVQGKETTTIDSPNAPAGTANSVAPAVEVSAAESAKAFEASIDQGIGEGPVALQNVTGGLVGGDSALAATATTTRVAVASRTPTPPPAILTGNTGGQTPGIGGAANLGNGNSGNGNGGAAATGGSGNSGASSGNGNGNGSAGAGNGNNGNGNSGSSGNGNSGNGNGNSGSGNGNNGNGNSGNGNSGNGNGNSGNGNGNGSNGNGNGNNGNGNGNGGGNGSNGNGNGNSGHGNGNGNGLGNLIRGVLGGVTGGRGNNGNGNGNGNGRGRN